MAGVQVVPAQVGEVVPVGGVVRLEDWLLRVFLRHLDLLFGLWRLGRCHVDIRVKGKFLLTVHRRKNSLVGTYRSVVVPLF